MDLPLAAGAAVTQPLPRAPPPSMSDVQVAAAAATALLLCIATVVIATRRRNRRHAPGRPRVVVLGGGFAGCQVAHDLEDEFDVAIIDTGGGFTHVPDALKALAGFCTPEDNHKRIEKLCPSTIVRLVTGMPKVDIEKRSVAITTAEGVTNVPYEHLVIATGSSYPSCSAIKCAVGNHLAQ